MSSSFRIIQPLKRLNVTDGLEITVERWNIAHQYHRQRQNIYYQSLHQAGIVWGLGVCVIAPPVDVSPQYRKRRWVQIQPGIAIDNLGNIIVVPQPIDFYISSQVNSSLSRLIYLVINYVDPQQLKLKNTIEVAETFQIDEQIQPPQEGEIELCRIRIEGEEIILETPSDVFNPSSNTLDLRYRQQAQFKPLNLIKIAAFAGESLEDIKGLNRLLKSIKGIYPLGEGTREIHQISINNETVHDILFEHDVIYLNQRNLPKLSPEQISLLQIYLNQGGTILIQVSTDNTKIEDFKKVEKLLGNEIDRIESAKMMTNNNQKNIRKGMDYLTKILPYLETELKETQNLITTEINRISLNAQQFAQRLGVHLESWQQLSIDHPLKNEPFLFQSLPTIKQQPLQILSGIGLIIIVGNFLSIFYENNQNLSREMIRNYQELSINILYLAYRRRQMQQLLQSS
ncbi:conserved hypothetical protein [Gloeothece citriformis PCC 7424]|uniref:DUF4159 domain-containing protein n=1 Tax=Gloeothece citriformis (strain PCC 7424) TaxID=65393 RepID=B7KC76_GLOC7|nr:hypothetical protein [Gloeothece citriformis]ACK70181.1 conserved hypothetical protein [Gloeothece citriformis PCC 7424]